jgi:phosphoribosylformimino-5-aminoimidazole carboxamide ribotide isomerase
VAVQGWAEQTKLSAVELAKKSEQEGAIAIIYTDIQRDGMLTGVNLEATRAIAGRFPFR